MTFVFSQLAGTYNYSQSVTDKAKKVKVAHLI